ncbi:MAG: DegT/DnrJ/EryC1/StrS family aminotransferase [bacterium]|nr:DegT/DnrJ/EryC1/StrS family aminotransferase [bacterium]
MKRSNGNKKYPLAKPNIGREEIANVTKVLHSGILSLGNFAKRFENEFARKIGTKHACAVSSGTAGLHLALLAAGIKDGDEVITTPFSFVASANSILYVGAKPVFVDIEPDTYNIDPEKIEKVITPKTKAILVVHIFGQACNMTPILRIAQKHKLKIIEDACESLLAEYKNKKTGTFGESAVFAFYPNKQITTGEGGMIITNNQSINALCRSLRNQGRSPDMKWLNHERLGYNYRMDEMSAALGLAQLGKVDKILKERANVAYLYHKHLLPYKSILSIPKIAAHNTHTWFVYVVRILNRDVDRDKVITDLEKIGIETKPYLPSIHLFSFYKNKFGYKKGDFPIAEEVSQNTLALPFYIGIKEKDIIKIVVALIKVIEKNGKGI